MIDKGSEFKKSVDALAGAQVCNAEERIPEREMTVGENIDMRLKELQYRTAELFRLKEETPSFVLKMRVGLLHRLANL